MLPWELKVVFAREGNMAKKLLGSLKLQVPAGAANPSPPIGPALGQRGINIMEFCKAFNARTAQEQKGTPLPVVITYYQDKSFTFEIKTPPASYLLKQAVKITSGSKLPGRDSAGTVTMDQCRKKAKKKLKDLNTDDVDAGAKIIAGSARAMGLQVTGA